MQIGAILLRWVEVLAAVFNNCLASWQARRSIIVTRQEARFELRRSGAAANNILANVAVGTRVPREILQALRHRFVIFELAIDGIVTRRLTVPAQAQDFLSGIVSNQIERLSPWPLAHAIYGFDATSRKDNQGVLDVRVFVAPRANIEKICDALASTGISPNRICVRPHAGAAAPLVTLWTSPTNGHRYGSQNLPQMIGAGIAAMIFLSATVSLWALCSASSFRSEYEDVAAHADAQRRHDQIVQRPRMLASLSPTEQAWALKEEAPAAVLILDALTRALPDSAYLTELRLESEDLRITGLAIDAPSLIAALEQSHHFTGVHFFAPTIKDEDSGLYRFSIAARVAPRRELIGD